MGWSCLRCSLDAVFGYAVRDIAGSASFMLMVEGEVVKSGGVG